MDYKFTEKAGKLKIRVNSDNDEILKLIQCAHIMIDVIEGTKSKGLTSLKSKFKPKNLSDIITPQTGYLGNSKKEIFEYSKIA
jgi:hypothetical protein